MERLMGLLMVLMAFLKVKGVNFILVVFQQVTTMSIIFQKKLLMMNIQVAFILGRVVSLDFIELFLMVGMVQIAVRMVCTLVARIIEGGLKDLCMAK